MVFIYRLLILRLLVRFVFDCGCVGCLGTHAVVLVLYFTAFRFVGVGFAVFAFSVYMNIDCVVRFVWLFVDMVLCIKLLFVVWVICVSWFVASTLCFCFVLLSCLLVLGCYVWFLRWCFVA